MYSNLYKMLFMGHEIVFISVLRLLVVLYLLTVFGYVCFLTVSPEYLVLNICIHAHFCWWCKSEMICTFTKYSLLLVLLKITEACYSKKRSESRQCRQYVN